MKLMIAKLDTQTVVGIQPADVFWLALTILNF